MQRLLHRAVVDRQRVLVARADARAQRHHECVVGQLLARAGVRDALCVIDPRQRAVDQLSLEVSRDRRERITACTGKRERFGDGHRPVDELLVGREHRDLHAVGREVLQGERGLDRSDAAAGDQHSKLR